MDGQRTRCLVPGLPRQVLQGELEVDLLAHHVDSGSHVDPAQFVGVVADVLERGGLHYLHVRGGLERANELFLFSQNRPLRSVHRDGGWTPQTVASHAMPALRAHFYPLERSQEVFSWDPA